MGKRDLVCAYPEVNVSVCRGILYSLCRQLAALHRYVGRTVFPGSNTKSSMAGDDSYQEVVAALNGLQTNASVLQESRKQEHRGHNVQARKLRDTEKYLARSGVTLEQLDQLSVIHVSGTKGKGSTCAFCESILRHSGFKTGFYSSPHLVAVRERIRIDGRPLSESEFVSHFWRVYKSLQAAKDYDHDMPPYFKFLTVLAFHVFLQEKVDVAIVEVGIGGEFDCTNILRKVSVVGITSLGLDHTWLLGNTIEDIAWQKAGIMKPGAVAFTVHQPAPAMEVLRRRSLERQCPLQIAPPLTDYKWDVEVAGTQLSTSVQALNASLAVQLANAWMAARKGVLRGHMRPIHRVVDGVPLATVFPIDPDVSRGVRMCSWPGRMQMISRRNVSLFLDGAHTLESLQVCAKWFQHTAQEAARGATTTRLLVFNMTGDRDVVSLLCTLLDCCFDAAIFCPNNVEVAMDLRSDQANLKVTAQDQLAHCRKNQESWVELCRKQVAASASRAMVFPSVADALRHVDEVASANRRRYVQVLVTGSLHLVGCVLKVVDPNLSLSTHPLSAEVKEAENAFRYSVEVALHPPVAGLPLRGARRSCALGWRARGQPADLLRLGRSRGEVMSSWMRLSDGCRRWLRVPASTTQYEDVVAALNGLQTNASVLQESRKQKHRGRDVQARKLRDTEKYLARSGVTLEQLDQLSVIHVSGTKGKGSTCAFCESILRHSGFKTGFYSSPHLVAVRERIRIDGRPLSESEFVSHFWRVYKSLQAAKDHDHDMPPYFKFLTVLAFHVFLQEKVDVAIVEVGIGGEFDCTNILRKVSVVGITSLGLDHTPLLGNTIEDIAWQKAGIMKPGAMAFTVHQPAPAMEVLRRRSLERQCPLQIAPPLTDYKWDVEVAGTQLSTSVQALNASLAVQLANAWMAARKGVLRGHMRPIHRVVDGVPLATVFPIDPDVSRGVRMCSWPGRMQMISRRNVSLFLDGAHTLESLQVCAKWFQHTAQEAARGATTTRLLVFNMTGDRDVVSLLCTLLDCCFDAAIFCPNNVEVAMDLRSDQTNLKVTAQDQLVHCRKNQESWVELCRKQVAASAPRAMVLPSVADALRHTEEVASADRRRYVQVLVTGSLHLVGCVLKVVDPNLSLSTHPLSAEVKQHTDMSLRCTDTVCTAGGGRHMDLQW